MQNASAVFSFILGAYLPLGNLRYLYFVLTALLYAVVVVLNTSLVAVICLSRSLHQPMYVLLCSLFVNELYGSTALFPFLLLQILSDLHAVSAPFCFLQIFCLYSYAHVQFCSLAVMAYDRYLAICQPLQYQQLMTCTRASVWVAALWVYSFVKFLITLWLNIRLPLCGNLINSLYCHNYLVVKLSCSDTRVNNIYGLVGTVLTVLVPLVPILFSYLRILQVCFSGSRQTRQKAVSTCSPHLISLLNFSFGCCFAILQSRFDMTSVPSMLQMFLSLYFLLIQPVLNPLLYGLQMTQIRKFYKRLLS
ncbi:unnamed protein product, partial [Tetraodon nigroviridis]